MAQGLDLKKDKGVLLESGTGEVELLTFLVDGCEYAINVMKIREILTLESRTKIPLSKPEVAGITLIRGETTTLIDLKMVLERQPYTEYPGKTLLLCEFNKMKLAFVVDMVKGIKRVSWQDIQAPDGMMENTLVIGNIQIEGRIVLMLDFERVVTEIAPATGITVEKLVGIQEKDRSGVKLVLADDSPTIRALLKDSLIAAGYTNLTFFNDGQQALDYLMGAADKFGSSFKEHYSLLITDLEMPQLDGYTLTKRIKTHGILKGLPVVIFSSLISEELRHKGESVGVDAQLSKPEIGELVKLVDSLIFG